MEKKKIFAHKCILVARSILFAGMFHGNFKESTNKELIIKVKQLIKQFNNNEGY